MQILEFVGVCDVSVKYVVVYVIGNCHFVLDYNEPRCIFVYAITCLTSSLIIMKGL